MRLMRLRWFIISIKKIQSLFVVCRAMLVFGLVSLVFSFHFAYANASTLTWEELEEPQKTLLKKLWAVGEPFDFQYALIAISYVESKLGLYPLNLQTYDCGVLHINIKSYLKFNNIKDSPINRNIHWGNLITDEDLSINAALNTLQYFYNYWSKRRKNPMEYAIKSYNAGFRAHSRTAQKYYNKVYKNIKAVKNLEKRGLLRQQRIRKDK